MNRAFSLVELSIVLVILGLLTGGILAGQSLIRASELRSVATEESRYVTAVGSFRDKYFALPGDMNNATKFWTAGTCPGTEATPSTTAATCDGNGDGMIGTIPTSYEYHRFWQHLANAGLIEGTYSGVRITSPYDFSFQGGVNVPRSKLSNGSWFTLWQGVSPISNYGLFEGSYDNTLAFGGWNPILNNNGGSDVSGILKPEEAWNIDTKMDDGNDTTGKVRTWEWNNTGCNTVSRSNSVALVNVASYNLTNSSPACALIFSQAF